MAKKWYKHYDNDECARVDREHPLYDIILNAYDKLVFPNAVDVCVCECCLSAKVRRNFFKYGQRNLPLNYLQEWYFGAVDQPMSKDTWGFMLPRIFEALATNAVLNSIGIEIVFRPFETGRKENWTDAQWQAIDQFQRQFLCDYETLCDETLDDVLCMFASGGWPLLNLLEQVKAWPIEKLVNILWNDWCTSVDWQGKSIPDIDMSAHWPKDISTLQFYSSKELYTRLFDYGMNDKHPAEMTGKALSVADLIYNPPRKWK